MKENYDSKKGMFADKRHIFFIFVGFAVLMLSVMTFHLFASEDVGEKPSAISDQTKTLSQAAVKPKQNEKPDSDNTIVISQADIMYSLFTHMARRILIKAYANLGKHVEFETYPARRSLAMANSGLTDGELARISGLKHEYHNLIEIPVSISNNEIYVYSKKHDFIIDGWQSLKPYKFDYRLGFKYAEQNSKGMNASRVNTDFQGLKKLDADRSDLFVGIFGARCAARQYNLKGIKALSPKLADLKMYHYLHKRNHLLAEQLEKELLRMQKTGELDLIKRRAKETFLSICR